jgi:hypothetical protein
MAVDVVVSRPVVKSKPKQKAWAKTEEKSEGAFSLLQKLGLR